MVTAAEPWIDRLQRDGYCIIPDLAEPAAIAALDNDLATAFATTPFGRGGFYGETTKRFGRLLARSPRTAAFAQHELVLGIVHAILDPFCDCIQLNVAQAIAVYPGAPAQMPHRDQDMWRSPVGEIEYLVNVIWPFTPFRADTGATHMWPGTHGRNSTISVPEDPPVVATMTPGSALIFLGSTLHGAGANTSDESRRAMVIGYSLGWLKPYENQWLAYPPSVARTFPRDLAHLVGYRQHRPNLDNFEGQCPSVLLDDPRDRPLGAVDALRPDQRDAVAAFLARQRRSR